ncbi:MAG: hypothetical protein KatS3mg022_2825 [Armatimonadota bacterium]|nr:MAG: hypothetical protein KatS3mg022_2825 [Armatimonadota bacterium]
MSKAIARKTDGERKLATEQAIIEQAQRELRVIWWRYTLWITILMFVAPLVMTVLAALLRIGQVTFLLLNFIVVFTLVQVMLYHVRQSYDHLKQLGRTAVQKHLWHAARAALEPFSRFGNRGFDWDGEAHYLLMRTYLSLGDVRRAEKARDFLLRNRRGKWVERARKAIPSEEGS